MKIQDFNSGKLMNGYQYQYFLPEKINHSFIINDPILQEKLESASFRLGELNSFGKFLPNLKMFIKSYVTKEAVTSSKIEGTKTDMEDAFTDESSLSDEQKDDWREVDCYIKATDYAIEELNKLPLSNRLLKETHQILLANSRGQNKQPGEFRKSQNWIGGNSITNASFIPPTSDHVEDLMSDLEKFLHNKQIRVPHLIKIAIAHYQFETIHPFLDGNGRIGRLLITIYLMSAGLLDKPILYTSDFFEANRVSYYQNLTLVRSKNDLNNWIIFFLDAIEKTSEKAITGLQNIIKLKHHLQTERVSSLGRKTPSAIKLIDFLFQNPVTSAGKIAAELELSAKAGNDMVRDFVNLGILEEVTNQKRNRIFVFRDYLKIMER